MHLRKRQYCLPKLLRYEQGRLISLVLVRTSTSVILTNENGNYCSKESEMKYRPIRLCCGFCRLVTVDGLRPSEAEPALHNEERQSIRMCYTGIEAGVQHEGPQNE